MKSKHKPYLYVTFGDDGNPEIEAIGNQKEQNSLCVALLAGMAATSGDIAGYLTAVMFNAAELLERLDEEATNEN